VKCLTIKQIKRIEWFKGYIEGIRSVKREMKALFEEGFVNVWKDKEVLTKEMYNHYMAKLLRIGKEQLKEKTKKAKEKSLRGEK
jgi:hypothetical protein